MTKSEALYITIERIRLEENFLLDIGHHIIGANGEVLHKHQIDKGVKFSLFAATDEMSNPVYGALSTEIGAIINSGSVAMIELRKLPHDQRIQTLETVLNKWMKEDICSPDIYDPKAVFSSKKQGKVLEVSVISAAGGIKYPAGHPVNSMLENKDEHFLLKDKEKYAQFPIVVPAGYRTVAYGGLYVDEFYIDFDGTVKQFTKDPKPVGSRLVIEPMEVPDENKLVVYWEGYPVEMMMTSEDLLKLKGLGYTLPVVIPEGLVCYGVLELAEDDIYLNKEGEISVATKEDADKKLEFINMYVHEDYETEEGDDGTETPSEVALEYKDAAITDGPQPKSKADIDYIKEVYRVFPVPILQNFTFKEVSVVNPGDHYVDLGGSTILASASKHPSGKRIIVLHTPVKFRILDAEGKDVDVSSLNANDKEKAKHHYSKRGSVVYLPPGYVVDRFGTPDLDEHFLDYNGKHYFIGPESPTFPDRLIIKKATN